jgi:hypothetical protein
MLLNFIAVDLQCVRPFPPAAGERVRGVCVLLDNFGMSSLAILNHNTKDQQDIHWFAFGYIHAYEASKAPESRRKFK